MHMYLCAHRCASGLIAKACPLLAPWALHAYGIHTDTHAGKIHIKINKYFNRHREIETD